jgi:signal transduction histidine kinase
MTATFMAILVIVTISFAGIQRRRMAAELRKANAERRKVNADLRWANTELRRAGEQKQLMNKAMQNTGEDLRLALAIAEDNAKIKSEILTNMNHELRTSMNGVLGFLQIALITKGSVAQQESILRAESCAKDLMMLIDKVLDFKEIESGKMRMNEEPFSVSAMFSEISKAFAIPVKAKGLALSLSYPANLPGEIIGDSQKLRRVLDYLVDNAVKFTDKGKVSVHANTRCLSEERIEIEFCVSDTGIGIHPELMTSLFDPFWQADTSSTRKYGGIGFGLALSKHLVKMLSGKIWVESEPGKGSTFRFTAHFRVSADRNEASQTNTALYGAATS